MNEKHRIKKNNIEMQSLNEMKAERGIWKIRESKTVRDIPSEFCQNPWH